MVSPIVCILSVLATFIFSFVLFANDILNVDEYFFITIPALIFIYTMVAVFKDHSKYIEKKWLSSHKKILGQYLFWGILTYLLVLLYQTHSFYSQAFGNAQLFFNFYFQVYLCLGLPYFVLADKFRSSFGNNRSDSYFLCVLIFRRFLRFGLTRLKFIRRHKAYRNLFVSWLLRIHFIPLMISQMLLTHQQVTKAIQSNLWDYATIVPGLMALVWSIDANNAAVGYFWESKFTKTRFREMDPYPLNWVVTVMCYLPFSVWVSVFLPQMVDHSQAVELIISDKWFLVTTDMLTLFFLFGYLWSGTSLYFSTSNMTYKGIQTKGPYSFVRHPATFFKVGFFTTLFCKFGESYTFVGAIAFIIWMGIYVARTICEERFLIHFEEYRNYQTKTKYRIIPGIY